MSIRRRAVAAPIRQEGEKDAKSGSIPTPKHPLAIRAQYLCEAERHGIYGIHEIH